MCLFLAACVHQCVRCVDNSHGAIHTGTRVGHMMSHAHLANSVAALARHSGDMHACLRKAQSGLGVPYIQLADTCLAMQWSVSPFLRPHVLIAGCADARFSHRVARHGAKTVRPQGGAAIFPMLLYCCCEESPHHPRMNGLPENGGGPILFKSILQKVFYGGYFYAFGG
jgi:hypothetical protein